MHNHSNTLKEISEKSPTLSSRTGISCFSGKIIDILNQLGVTTHILSTSKKPENVTFEDILQCHTEGKLLDILSRTDTLIFSHSTDLPNVTNILQALIDKIFPILPPHENRSFFFDLTNAQQQTSALLPVLKKFQTFGAVTLFSTDQNAEDLRRELEIACVISLKNNKATAAYKQDQAHIDISEINDNNNTEHFLAGFITGELCNLSSESKLHLAAAFLAYAKKNKTFTTIEGITSLISSW